MGVSLALHLVHPLSARTLEVGVGPFGWLERRVATPAAYAIRFAPRALEMARQWAVSVVAYSGSRDSGRNLAASFWWACELGHDECLQIMRSVSDLNESDAKKMADHLFERLP